MKVDFNGLRTQLANNWNTLIPELNDKIRHNEVIILTANIQDELDEMRSLIATLLALYDEKGEFDSLPIDLEEFNS